jgi:hypothetical protein
VIYFTEAPAGSAYCSEMAEKTYPSFDPKPDLTTDYALIATGVGAALIALIFLILA